MPGATDRVRTLHYHHLLTKAMTGHVAKEWNEGLGPAPRVLAVFFIVLLP